MHEVLVCVGQLYGYTPIPTATQHNREGECAKSFLFYFFLCHFHLYVDVSYLCLALRRVLGYLKATSNGHFHSITFSNSLAHVFYCCSICCEYFDIFNPLSALRQFTLQLNMIFCFVVHFEILHPTHSLLLNWNVHRLCHASFTATYDHSTQTHILVYRQVRFKEN